MSSVILTDGFPDQQSAYCLSVEGNKRIEISPACYRFRKGDNKGNCQKSCNEAIQIEYCCHDNYEYPRKLEGVAQFKVRLSKISNCDKCHYQHDFGRKQFGTDGEITENKSTDDAE